MNFERFAATVFVVLSLFVGSAAAQLEENPRLMQGPMIGAVAPESALVWVRTSGPFHVSIEYADNPYFENSAATAGIAAAKANDYCVTSEVSGLSPGSKYYYRVRLDGEIPYRLSALPPRHFTTAPSPETAGTFRVAFGSCAHVREDFEQPIWDAIKLMEPDLFLWTGDNIYGDAFDNDILAEEFRRQREVPGIIDFLATTPQLAIWDDHDYGLNNSDRRHPEKEGALAVWKNYWPNPGYGLPDTPGIFFSYSYGGVDFFMLDNRYYRDPNDMPDGPEKTQLGEAQLAWFKEQLAASSAPFKVVVAGGGFNLGKRIPGADSWASFRHERDGILDFIVEEEISGVVFVTGDTHVGELNAIPRSEDGGYDLYEFVSSPLAQSTYAQAIALAPEMRIRPTYADAANAGILEFDMTAPPTLRFTLINEYGRIVYDWFEVTADELVNGVASAEEKQSEDAKRMDVFSRGGIEKVMSEGMMP